MATSSGKAQIITDMEAAEVFASAPASEAIPVEKVAAAEETITTNKVQITPIDPQEPAIVFDPTITIQPFEPSSGSDRPVDTATTGVIIKSGKLLQELPDQEVPAPPKPTPTEVDNTPLTFEELIARAEDAASKQDYAASIKLYWNALGLTNSRAGIWNALAKIYLIDGQPKNAATSALEATRLDPENVQYILDYLRIVQQIKKPSEFIKELEIAYDRFPRSPEIILSLARGYLRLGGNDYAASILSKRFIQLAPNHPLRPEAEAALSRTR